MCILRPTGGMHGSRVCLHYAIFKHSQNCLRGFVHCTSTPGFPIMDLRTHSRHFSMREAAADPPIEPARSRKIAEQHMGCSEHCKWNGVGPEHHAPSQGPSWTLRLGISCIKGMHSSWRGILGASPSRAPMLRLRSPRRSYEHT